jgi:hypothetical protein
MVVATEDELERAGAGSPEVVIADAGYWHKRQMENIVRRTGGRCGAGEDPLALEARAAVWVAV